MFILLHKKRLVKCFALFVLGAGAVMMGRGTQSAREVSAMQEPIKGYLAIVIDDFGYRGEGSKDMLDLPMPLTAAVMPFSEYSAEEAQLALAAGKEAIIHMPMESLTGKKSWVGDKGVFRNLTDEEIRGRVTEAMEIVPNAVALNNHMGSAIMEDKRCLSAVMDVIGEHGLFFLDSMTTPNSVAEEVCNEKNIVLLRRNVFLDSTDDIAVVKKQLHLAADIAMKEGSAIAIGHVGPEGGNITVEAIKELAPELEKQGIQLVSISDLAKIQENKINKK